jgi:lipid-A-disaccharide synthase
MDELYIISNSPGEVSGWVKPVSFELSRRNIPARVTLVVLPCQYASGMEKECGRGIEGIDDAVTFRELCKRAEYSKEGKKLVLQLGGDPLFGAVLSLRFGCGWMIYTARPKWRIRVGHYFIPDRKSEERFISRGINAEKYTRVGNLILDSVPELKSVSAAKAKLELKDGEESICLLPGSRPFEYQDGFAFFSLAAQEILNRFPNYSAFLPVAPTVEESRLEDGLKRAGLRWTARNGCADEILWNGKGRIRIIREHNFEAIKASRLAVAFPGTNNLQIASLGVPLLMVAPLNEAENIPLDGIPGIIPMSMPGARQLKKNLVYWYNRREKFVSLPNRLTGKPIIPEYRGIMTPSMVAALASDLLQSPERLQKIVDGYSDVPLMRGASAKIAERVISYYAG